MTGRGRGRLPSFMGKRDLTLGAAAAGSGSKKTLTNLTSDKKKFVPNLNVQRKSKTDQQDGAAGTPTAGTSGTGHQKKASKWKSSPAAAATAPVADKKAPFKPRQELIQTMDAVFGEGVSSDGIRRKKYGGGGDGREGANSLERPKLNLNLKVDKEAEAERLKALLKDDFVDDLSSGPLVPVQLPMVDTGTLFKKENEEADEEEGKKIKMKSNRILDSDDDEEEESDVKVAKKSSVIETSSDTKKQDMFKNQLTFPDLVKDQKGDLFFIQLPDHLPGVTNSSQEEKEGDGEATAANKADRTAEELHTKCTLSDLSEGYLGKIQIRKSGKTQLVLGSGSTHMNLDLGTQVGFLQDLVAVNVPDQQESEDGETPAPPPDMTVIGHIGHRLVVAPDWSKLFASEVQQSSSSDEENDHS